MAQLGATLWRAIQTNYSWQCKYKQQSTEESKSKLQSKNHPKSTGGSLVTTASMPPEYSLGKVGQPGCIYRPGISVTHSTKHLQGWLNFIQNAVP